MVDAQALELQARTTKPNPGTHNFAASTCIAVRLRSGPNRPLAISTPEEFDFFYSAVT